MEPRYEEYDRITDVLMYMNQDITLNFVVSLAKASKNNQRMFYHYETQYKAKRYDGEVRSIKRNMNYFFVLDNKQDFGNGLLLRPSDVELLKMLIDKQVLPWFYDKDKYAYKIIDEKMYIGNYEPVTFTQSATQFIQFTPTIFSYENDTYKEGIRMNINTNGVVDITLDRFMQFYNILHTDMYIAACCLCNYVKSMPYGINSHVMGGLGGGRFEDNWNDTGDISTNEKGIYKNITKNNFLDNISKKEE